MRHTSILTLCFLLGSCQEINPAANRQLPSAPAIDQTESPAEANILMAYAQLDDFIDICLGSIQCGLAKQEEDVLNLIRQSLQQEFSKPNQIQFESENARPGFFLQEGEIHIARTGEEVGSHVYFNRDLLYVEASDGSKHPLNMFRAIGLLVQKLGEHHRITDRTFLANLGGKVSQAVLLNTQNIKKGRYQRHLSMQVIDQWSQKANSVLLVHDGERTSNETDNLGNAYSCSEGEKVGLWVYNLHWSTGTPVDDQSWQQIVEGNVTVFCEIDADCIEPKVFGVKGRFEMSIDEQGRTLLTDNPTHWESVPGANGLGDPPPNFPAEVTCERKPNLKPVEEADET